MADIRCPMCGKPNPADQDVCQFCQARLKPLRISFPTSEETSEAPHSYGDDEEPADWLRALRSEGSDAPETTEPEEDSPVDWLSSFRSEETPKIDDLPQEDLPGEPAQEFGDEAELQDAGNDWMANLRYSVDSVPLPEEPDREPETPEPFASDEAEGAWESEEDQAGDLSGASSEDEQPEWLRRIRERQSMEPQEDAGAIAADSSENLTDTPDWLASIISAPDEETPEQGEAAADDLDWLTTLETSDEASSLGVEDEVPEEAELPEPSQATSEDFEEVSSGDIPDWLADIDQSTTTPSEEPADTESSSQPESQEGELVEAEATLPEPSEEPQTPSPEPEATQTGEPDEFSWLREFGAAPVLADDEEPPAASGEPASPLAPDEDIDEELEPLQEAEMPDWLAGIKPIPAEDEAQSSGALVFDTLHLEPEEEPPAEPGLQPADLPGWLEAMRPIEPEAVFPTEGKESRPETAGPLAGLRGVLPAEPDVSRLSRPPAYSNKLLVSELQKGHAELFETLIKTEAEPRPIPSRSVISSQHLLRWLIAVILIAGITWSLLSGSPEVNAPAFPTETGVASQLINGLNPGAPVLVAFDYEPGWSGEMDATAAPVLDHLMVKGAFLAVVSTTPTGPFQAERLIARVNSEQNHQYLPGENYENFGYIPGGLVGLLSFAQSPRQVVPGPIGEGKGWESTSLRTVRSLSNFNLMFVITENPDTARSWIEQVQPSLSGVPLIMVVSAQAEPLVKPYYLGNPSQVQGMVTGLMGGASYENLNGRAGLARGVWNTFSFSLLLAAALILAGGIISAAIVSITESREAKKKV